MNDTLINHDLAKIVLHERALLVKAQTEGTKESWQVILDTPCYWSLRHEDQYYSVKNMSDREIEQSLIEDLLFTTYNINRGAAAIYPKTQPYQHLKDAYPQISRIYKAINKMNLEGYIIFETILINEDLRTIIFHLNPDKMKDAQEFSGVYIDDIVSVGGENLLGDVLDDIIKDIE